MAGMAHAMGATLTGAQKLLGKIKIFIYSYLNLYFATHAFMNCKAASTPRPYLKHCVGRVALPPLSTMTKLRHCDITRGSDIATEQEPSLAMFTRPRPSHAIRKDKLVLLLHFRQVDISGVRRNFLWEVSFSGI